LRSKDKTMNQIQPRITRRELQQLIRQGSWRRLGKRLEQAEPQDVAAQLPGLHPQQRQALLQFMSRRSGAGLAAR
jgi:flagellar motility protein MotE (MotC chaperone)